MIPPLFDEKPDGDDEIMEAVSARPRRWNHNLHYHRVILDAVPDGCRGSLDVGCGKGMLARELRRIVPHVTGIDRDAASIDVARRVGDYADLEYIVGDFMTHPFEPASFDHIASIAALHHMDAAAALDRMRALLAPGGTLAIVGLARSRSPGDLGYDLAGAVATRAHKLRKAHWETSAPKLWPPPETYGQVRRIARRTLPGSRYHRHMLFRYSLTWAKPLAD